MPPFLRVTLAAAIAGGLLSACTPEPEYGHGFGNPPPPTSMQQESLRTLNQASQLGSRAN